MNIQRTTICSFAVVMPALVGQLQAQHQIRIDADPNNDRGTFAPVHGVNASPKVHGDWVKPGGGVEMPDDSWTRTVLDQDGVERIYNREWLADYTSHFKDLAIPQSRAHSPATSTERIWKNKLKKCDPTAPHNCTVDKATVERDFALRDDGTALDYTDIADYANYDLSGAEQFMDAFEVLDLDTQMVLTLGNPKGQFQDGPLAGTYPIGLNAIPNDRPNFAHICDKLYRYLNQELPQWNWPDQTWTPRVSLIEVWNEPYVNEAWLEWYETDPNSCNGSQDPDHPNLYTFTYTDPISGLVKNYQVDTASPFWNESGQAYADVYARLISNPNAPYQPARTAKLLASLNFPRDHANNNGAAWRPNQPLPFTSSFLQAMQSRYDVAAASEKWKAKVEGVAVHWYVDSPEEFIERFHNIDMAFAHRGLTFVNQPDANNVLYPEVWVTEWNRHRDATGAINYVSSAGAAPFLINGLYYLDGLANGDFTQDITDDNGAVIATDQPFSVPLGGAQVFGAQNLFWTREGIGPFNTNAGSKTLGPGRAWTVYGETLFQETPNRMEVLEGVLVAETAFTQHNPDEEVPYFEDVFTNKNVTVMAGQTDANDKIVIVVSSVDRTVPGSRPDENFPGDTFPIQIQLENVTTLPTSVKRQAAWSGSLAYESELVDAGSTNGTYDASTQILTLEPTDMRRNSYEVYTIEF